MTFPSIPEFETLRPAWPVSEAEQTHGTTVLAIRFNDGVLVLADRRATMGSLIMYEQAEKIVPIDATMVLAVSGAYARSLEICRFLRHSMKYYERLNLVALSSQAKIAEVSRALAANLPAAQGGGLFLPIAATYDPSTDQFAVQFFDAAGGCFESGDYACAGSGSERIRGVFEYVSRAKGAFRDMELAHVVEDGLRLLEIASELDSATGGFRRVLPSAIVLSREGVNRLDDSSLRRAVEAVSAGRA